MNIREQVAYLKPIVARREPAHYVKDFTIDNATMGEQIAELERLWRIEECANEVEQLERELAEAQAEIARLRAIPRPPEPMGMTAQKLQWNSDVQHYESLLREQK